MDSESRGRYIAASNSQLFRTFIKSLSEQTGKEAHILETQIVKYLKNQDDKNWTKVGLKKSQANEISGLYDDLPHMNKVRKWVSENVTKIIRVETRIAAKAYALIKSETRTVLNPYKFHTPSTSAMMSARRSSVSPYKSINQKQLRVLEEIKTINNRSVASTYKTNLLTFQKRGKDFPSIHANGQEIVESAATINRLTGHAGMNKGCKSFNTTASEGVIDMKANLDIYRAKLVQEKAFNKAGKKFNHYDDVADDLRLTKTELDESTVRSFEDVLGYSNVEARAAVKRLSNPPCSIY